MLVSTNIKLNSTQFHDTFLKGMLQKFYNISYPKEKVKVNLEQAKEELVINPLPPDGYICSHIIYCSSWTLIG